jgi:phosphomannomutase
MSKKYFGTDGIRGTVGEQPITPDFFLRLGWATGRVFAEEGQGFVLVGKDTRISGYMFESALEAGLSAAGVNTRLLGPMPTPGIAYLTRTLRAQAGIVISASHNPYYDNGIKFFSNEGVKLADELEHKIEYYLDQPMNTVASDKLGKAKRLTDASGRYIEFCKASIPASIDFNGLRIVVDCANGSTYHIAPHVFSEVGAEVIPTLARSRSILSFFSAYSIPKLLINVPTTGPFNTPAVLLALAIMKDGVVAALQILAEIHKTGKSLYELKSEMSKYPQVLLNVRVSKKVSTYRSPTLARSRSILSFFSACSIPKLLINVPTTGPFNTPALRWRWGSSDHGRP